MVGIEWLVALTALASVRSESAPEQQCAAPTNPTIKFSFDSHRNETGYWISQFDFEKGGERKTPSDGKKTTPYSVDVEQSSVACGGIESTLHVKINVAVPPPKVAPGYELFPGFGYYKFHPVITNWAHARRLCAEEGAHLLIVNTEKEAQVVKTLFLKYPATDNWSWVGIHETGTNGNYFTIFGDTVEAAVPFFRWVPTQPNDVGPNDCVVITRAASGLEDCPCTNGYPFICEQEIW